MGHLNHTCKVVRSGRSFLWHMFDLPSHSSARMRLSRGFRSDLDWWQEFVLQWNGVSFLSPLPPASARHVPRRLRLMGLWGVASVTLAASTVGTSIPVPLNHGEGTGTDHPGLRPVGPSLAGQASPLPLRQSGSGGLPALQDEQERGAYAPIALPGF